MRGHFVRVRTWSVRVAAISVRWINAVLAFAGAFRLGPLCAAEGGLMELLFAFGAILHCGQRKSVLVGMMIPLLG